MCLLVAWSGVWHLDTKLRVSHDSVPTQPAGSTVESPPQPMSYPQEQWGRKRMRATVVGDEEPLGSIKQECS